MFLVCSERCSYPDRKSGDSHNLYYQTPTQYITHPVESLPRCMLPFWRREMDAKTISTTKFTTWKPKRKTFAKQSYVTAINFPQVIAPLRCRDAYFVRFSAFKLDMEPYCLLNNFSHTSLFFYFLLFFTYLFHCVILLYIDI